MSTTTSMERRSKTKPSLPPFNPIKNKFEEEFKDFSEIEILKEFLFYQRLQTNKLRSTATDINTIKWLVLISFVASIITGIVISINS